MLTSRSFVAMGCRNSVVVTDAAALDAAFDAATSVITEIDRVCSRFAPDSELSRLNARAGGGAVAVSPVLWTAVAVAFDAAAATGGLVDPTVGGCLEKVGYTVTFRDMAPAAPAVAEFRVQPAPGWTAVTRNALGRSVTLPAGVHLDLGATGKAWAADMAAAAAAIAAECGVMVNCGGDIAVAGEPPGDGWPVRVAEHEDGSVWEDIAILEGGVATSSPLARRWTRGDAQLHHIIHPATGLPAATRWRMATVIASTCSGANAAATAAILLDTAAPAWLDEAGMPARLVGHDGSVHLSDGWPR